MTLYDQVFYDMIDERSRLSARVVVPLVAKHVPISSVCDVGCGRGVWLRTFLEHGTKVIRGLDGGYVDKNRLHIPQLYFRPTDLSQPLQLEERFDLAVSLEVAEHLPQHCAAEFVRGLTQLSDCILFSAAIPGQRGTGHVNEQWQHQWASMFLEHGYEAFDIVRPAVWADDRVDWWYRQNTLLYVKDWAVQESLAEHRAKVLDVVHPLCYVNALNMAVKQ